MTAPTEQKGLFDTLCLALDFRDLPLSISYNVKQHVMKTCEKFERRLAEAEKEIEQRLADANSSGQTAAIAYGAELRKSQLLSEQLASAHQEARDQMNTACGALAELERVRGLAASLFDRIKHGDHSHQDWLRHEIQEHFKAAPQQEPDKS